MASTLPSSADCCYTCGTGTTTTSNVPGPQGPPGTNGTDGTDGLNAFSSVVGGTTLIPAYDATVLLELDSPPGSYWVGQGQILYVQSVGYFRVDGIPDPLHVILYNLGYPGNVDGDGILTFPSTARVQPGGLQGPSGAASTSDVSRQGNYRPEGVEAAPQGTFFMYTNDAVTEQEMWYKLSGGTSNTGWQLLTVYLP